MRNESEALEPYWETNARKLSLHAVSILSTDKKDVEERVTENPLQQSETEQDTARSKPRRFEDQLKEGVLVWIQKVWRWPEDRTLKNKLYRKPHTQKKQ